MKTYEELQAENAALVAQIETLREVVRGVNPKAKFIALTRLNHVMALTPEQCLNEIRAEAVEEALDATYYEIRNRIGKDYSNIVESIILEYAAKVWQGDEI